MLQTFYSDQYLEEHPHHRGLVYKFKDATSLQVRHKWSCLVYVVVNE